MRAFNRSASCDLDAACSKSLRCIGNTRDRHRLGAPRVASCLREARSRVGRIRPIPATSVACATCWKRHIACNLPHEEGQFSATISETFLPLATAARIYRSCGRGRGGWNVPTAADSRKSALPDLISYATGAVDRNDIHHGGDFRPGADYGPKVARSQPNRHSANRTYRRKRRRHWLVDRDDRRIPIG